MSIYRERLISKIVISVYFYVCKLKKNSLLKFINKHDLLTYLVSSKKYEEKKSF